MDGFIEWLRVKAPYSIGDYARYYERYREALSSLDLARLPCNSWLLKLVGNYIEYLLYHGAIDFTTYAAKKAELRLRRQACSPFIGRRGEGIGRCPESLNPLEGPVYWVWRGLLESGVRAKHLWRITRIRPEEVDGALVWDVRVTTGTKRVNIIVLDPEETAPRLHHVLSSYSYSRLRDTAARRRAPLSCARKIHWNLCIAATGDRQLCGFIQGRWRPTDIAHYEDYKYAAVRASRLVWPLAHRFLDEGIGLRRLLDDLKYYTLPDRIEPGKKHIPRLEAEGPGEPGGNVDADVVSVLTLYSNRLG
ncbi:MAG: hypothetical protein GSR84_03070 [Desulfurococcales archaeon]|nr:hypothetical protein [Desulfurococcales archaeon]